MPQTDLDCVRRLRVAVAQRLTAGPLQIAVERATEGYTAPGVYSPDRLFWGPVENFTGMERPVVIAVGFRHPLYLVERERRVALDRQIDPLVYQALTRSTFRVSIVEPHARLFGRHYQIHGKDDEGFVPECTDERRRTPNRAMWDGAGGVTGATELPCIRLRQEVDLRAASATASVERSVWLGFTRPFGIDDWRKVDWSKCAQLRQLDLAGRLVPLRPGASAAGQWPRWTFISACLACTTYRLGKPR
jgi:hypothetical protein